MNWIGYINVMLLKSKQMKKNNKSEIFRVKWKHFIKIIQKLIRNYPKKKV